MIKDEATMVLVHGASADGSSWRKVVDAIHLDRIKEVTCPLPLTSLADDVAALDRTLERVDGPVVLAGHAYAGAVIAATRGGKVKGLVEQDRMIVPRTQRFMAERMNSRISPHLVDHTPSVTAPGPVVDLIRDALNAVEAPI